MVFVLLFRRTKNNIHLNPATMEKNKGDKKYEFELTELFLVVADLKRTFVGSMRSGKDEDGREFVSGKVTVKEGVMVGRAETDRKMAEQLDIVCKLKLDYNLHGRKGKTSMILGTDYNHN